MQKTIRNGEVTIRYKLLGRENGGFHERFGDAKITASNLVELRRSFGNSHSTMMIASGGPDVVVVDLDTKEVRGDALITTNAGHNLILRPADCLPLLLVSSQPTLLALVHASRTSLEQGIIENALKKMVSLGLNPKDCIAHIGPGIGPETYLLPLKIKEQLHQPSWAGNMEEGTDSVALNLAGFVDTELRRLGVASHITRSNLNTAEDSRYFSHYQATRNGVINGRNGFVCALELTSA